VIEFYATRDVADRALAEILHDEPDRAGRFMIVMVDLRGATDRRLGRL
jgi:hypothetical protein